MRIPITNLLGALMISTSFAADPSASEKEFFQKQVRPVLLDACVKCHGAEKQKGGLRLDSREAMFKGGDENGPAVVVGNPDRSPLILAIRQSGELKMPKKGDKLSDKEIEALTQWVKLGAPWPGDAKGKGGKEQGEAKHWAWKPVASPAIPKVRNSKWAKTPIDAFVLAKLETQKISPSPAADRRTLIRRAYFDVIGLPPSPEEVDAFLNDPSPGAYEKLVDHLLASPEYGERWARHWLDVVRFAESNGFEMNQPRPNAWPYRDWVIRSLNEDKPYDQFIREQLAGDALGADEATGYLVGGPWDQVKSPDPVLTAQQRMDELHDMVATTGTAFLGLTVGCARCHNHKFDPILQKDYYSIQAVFAGVNHGERTQRPPDAEVRLRQAGELQKRVAALNAQLAEFEPLARTEAGAPLRSPVHARLNAERILPVAAKFLRFTIFATTDAEPCLDELEVFTAEEKPRNVALATAGTKASASGTLPGFAIHKLEHINDGLFGNGRSWISHERGQGWVQLEFPETISINRIVWARDREEKYTDRLATNYKIEVATTAGEWKLVAGSADREPYVVGAKPRPAYVNDPGAAPLLAEKKQLDDQIRELTKMPAIYSGTFSQPGETFRLHRGDPLQKKEPVSPGGITSVSPLLELPAGMRESERRLALARWITDPENPLAARVMVNRIWQHYFGEGIVATPSDFGANGVRPTHPELLDWLATELVTHGWHPKAIHRLILLSNTYQQASTTNARAMAVDAGSRFLWRYPPRRLEAEPIRDAILSVSGKLDLKRGGPGFDLFEPNDNYVRVYNPKKQFGSADWRRMIYATKVRMRLDDVFGAFDCPDAGQVAPRRTRSTTPLQALNLLNSAFLVQQAIFFAARLQKDAGTEPPAQVRRAFRLAFGREPTAPELEESKRFIEQNGLMPFCRALFNANEFVYVL